MRAQKLADAKKSATSIQQLLADKAVAATFAPRKDKLAGDPIWTEAFHHFMALKKGQSFRCAIVKKERTKDADGRWVWKTQWARHQKRYMSMTMEEFRECVIKWTRYLNWREVYLAKNPRLPPTWHVGVKRLYKEKCFCVDEQENVRKCGCEYHLKMGELVAALKRWRRAVHAKILEKNPGHSCSVYVLLFSSQMLCAHTRMIIIT